jgi:hypothetical protein
MVYEKLLGQTIEERFGGEEQSWRKWIGFLDQVAGIGAHRDGPPDIGEMQ